jgi:large subunit ribosomal protein L20
MPRATNNVASKNRRKKVLKNAKGYYQGRRKLFQNAKEAVNRGRAFAYRDRKARKRTFRTMWIARINAAVRNEGLTYSRFMAGLKAAGIEIDRKSLSQLAITDADGFKALIEQAKSSLDEKQAA